MPAAGLYCERVNEQHPYSPQHFERIRIGKAVGTDGKPLPARTVTIRVLSESAQFLSGLRVDKNGEPVGPVGVDEVREMIALEAITKRTPLRLNLHYGELEETPRG